MEFKTLRLKVLCSTDWGSKTVAQVQLEFLKFLCAVVLYEKKKITAGCFCRFISNNRSFNKPWFCFFDRNTKFLLNSVMFVLKKKWKMNKFEKKKLISQIIWIINFTHRYSTVYELLNPNGKCLNLSLKRVWKMPFYTKNNKMVLIKVVPHWKS